MQLCSNAAMIGYFMEVINFASLITHKAMKKILFIAVLCLMVMGAQAQEKLYEVKSGIVTLEIDMMGRKVVQDLYFDDYGAKQATMLELQGKKIRGIEVNGENIMIDDEQKTATKMPAMGMTTEKINFLDKSDKNIRKNKIKELGTETIAGKECTKYSVAVFVMGQVIKQTVWVYKGITLKSSINTDFGTVEQVATNLVEDVEIPAETFEIPEGVKVQQMSRPPMMGGEGF